MKLDFLLILGYIGMLTVMYLGLTLAKGTPSEVWSAEGAIMAFGGAIIGTIAGLSMQELRDALQALKVAFTVRVFDYERLIGDFVGYAGISRKDGILALEGALSRIDEPFVRRALQMAIDGVDSDLMEERLAVELTTAEERHARSRNVFDTMATYSPAFGMIGTIMGLVLVLKALNDPSKLGPKMAVALLSTFYGVFACYAVFTPIAKKLERKHRHEMLYKQMIVKGIVWIQTGDSPRIIEGKMRAFLREKKA